MKVLYNVVRAVNVALLSLAVAACVFFGWLFVCNMMKLPTPQLGPMRIYVVLSNSMAPEFYTNDAIFVTGADPERLDSGDVITFNASGSDELIVTHRIIEVVGDAEGRSFRTQGDNNNTPDAALVPSGSVVGKYVLRVPYFGYYMNIVNDAPYLVIFPVVAVIVVQFCFGWVESYLKTRLPAKGGQPPSGDTPPDGPEPQQTEAESGEATEQDVPPQDVGEAK